MKVIAKMKTVIQCLNKKISLTAGRSISIYSKLDRKFVNPQKISFTKMLMLILYFYAVLKKK